MKQRLSYAIESAALAAAKTAVSATDAEIEAAGQRYFNANFPAGFMGGATPTVTFTISANKREITVDGSVDMPTALMTVLGFDEMAVSTGATALRESKGLELAIALDNTGSMGGYIDDLQDAAKLLLDTLYGGEETVENLWVAVLPFDTRVNLANYPGLMDFTPSKSWRVCNNPRPAPYTVDDTAPDPMVANSEFSSQYTDWNDGCKAERAIGLTAERSTIDDTLDGMDAEEATRIDVAAAWTFRMLSPEYRGKFGNPDLPLDFNAPLMDKAAIIMSDGENNAKDGTSDATADARLLQACTAMKNENIIVYTIIYREDDEDLHDLMRSCATSPAHFFYAAEDDLSAVFNEIANQLSNLRLLNVT